MCSEAFPAANAICVAGRKLRKSSRSQLEYKPLKDNEEADSEQRKSAVSNYRSTKYRDAASPTGTELVLQEKRGRMTTNRYEPLNDDGERGIQNDPTDNSCSGEGEGEDVPGPSRAEEVEPGMCEAGGLLSTPNVKMVIFIPAMVQVELYIWLGLKSEGRRNFDTEGGKVKPARGRGPRSGLTMGTGLSSVVSRRGVVTRALRNSVCGVRTMEATRLFSLAASVPAFSDNS